MTIRIDPHTADLVRAILSNCRRTGLDPVAELDRQGLLSYRAKRDRERHLILGALNQMLHAMTPTMLGGGIIPATAADMKRCILETIERQLDD